MSRPTRNIKRPRATRRERRTVLVVTEGQTEKEYIEGLRQVLRSGRTQVTAVKVVEGKGEPRRVLRTAQGRMDSSDYDDVWIVLDVDEHPQLEPVLKEATELNMKAAVSNPCFEVWIVWHFDEVAHESSREAVQRAARRYGVDKSLPLRFPYDRRTAAADRAARRRVSLNEIGPNPSTAFPALLDEICAD